MTEEAPRERTVQLSVVIPVHNEAENIAAVSDEVAAALGNDLSFELVFVDDGSIDDTAILLRQAKQRHPTLRILRHGTRSGQSAAIRTGVKAAAAPWIVTLDGDGQNDPADIRPLVDLAWEHAALGPVLVTGLRQKRQDSWSRRLATRIANGVRQALLKDGCTDTGCSLKVFQRSAFLDLPYFDGMHRFMPALFQMYGHRCHYRPVNHRPRRHGTTKYTNWRRALIGIADLRGVLWLKRRTVRPDTIAEE